MKKQWKDVKPGDRVVVEIGAVAIQRHWTPPMIRMRFNLRDKWYYEDVDPDALVEVLEAP